MNRKTAGILLTIMLPLFSALLTGCWDRRELEERISVVAIGIDNAQTKEKMYKLTIQIPIPNRIAGSGGKGGGNSGSAVKVMSVTGWTVSDAMNKLQQRLNQRLFLGHTRVVAISEDVAKEGLQPILDGFRRDPTIRRLLWPIVVKGEAASLLKVNPQLVQIPVVYLMDLIESGSKMGMIPDQTLGNFFIQTSNHAQQPFLNYVETGKNEVAWRGLAVFQKYKMVGVLNDVSSWVLMQLRDGERGGDIVLSVTGKKGEFITFRPHFVKSKLRINHLDGESLGHQAHYECRIQGDIIETTSKATNIRSEESISYLQNMVKQELQRRAMKLFDQLQREYRIDILQIGMALKAHHYHDYWEKHDWQRDFPNMKITVNYDVRIRRMGMEMQ